MLHLDVFFAIGDNYDEGIAGVHLVECVHHHCERVIPYNEENDCGLVFFIALDESDGAVFHFACAHCLSVHVVELFYLEGRLLCDGHRLPLAQQVQ